MKHWFKTIVAFRVNGETWSSNRHAGYKVPPPDGLDVVKGEPLAKQIAAALAAPEASMARTDCGNLTAGAAVFQAHLIDYATELFPGCAWHLVTTDRYAPACAFLDGKPCAVVMPKMVTIGHPEAPSFPPCPECDGVGAGECAGCEGTGEVECMCTECDNEHTRTCTKCKGSKKGDACAECGGTGRWTAGGAVSP